MSVEFWAAKYACTPGPKPIPGLDYRWDGEQWVRTGAVGILIHEDTTKKRGKKP